MTDENTTDTPPTDPTDQAPAAPGETVASPAAVEVPDLSQAKLLAWVDEDAEQRLARAASALDVENAKEKPRASVVKALHGIVNPDGDQPEGEGRYLATADFTGMVFHTTVSFKAGTVIDSLAAAELVAAGAPVEFQQD